MDINYMSEPSSFKKWEITLFSALIFIIVIHPYTYKVTQNIFGSLIGRIENNGCPTSVGIIFHTIVYILLVRFSMDLNLFK